MRVGIVAGCDACGAMILLQGGSGNGLVEIGIEKGFSRKVGERLEAAELSIGRGRPEVVRRKRNGVRHGGWMPRAGRGGTALRASHHWAGPDHHSRQYRGRRQLLPTVRRAVSGSIATTCGSWPICPGKAAACSCGGAAGGSFAGRRIVLSASSRSGYQRSRQAELRRLRR